MESRQPNCAPSLSVISDTELGKMGEARLGLVGFLFFISLFSFFLLLLFHFFFLFLLKETKPLSKLVSDNLCPKDG